MGADGAAIGKASRNAVEDAMAGLRPRVKGAAAVQSDPTVPILAELIQTMSGVKAGRRKAKAAGGVQGDLFAHAKALHSPFIC